MNTSETTSTFDHQPSHVFRTTEAIPEMRIDHARKVFRKKKAIFRFYQLVWYIVGIVEVLLMFRVALKALAANPYNEFTAFIYQVTTPLARPFVGILSNSIIGNSVFERSTIIGGIVYLLIAYAFIYLLQLVKPVDQTEVSQEDDHI